MPPYFNRPEHHLDIQKQADVPNQGFRQGQIGALHAVLAHMTVHDDPAVVCLPTGYGKTSVMMALPFLLKAHRVLVVEPTNALRRQVASHFRELSTLKRIGAIDTAIPNPATLLHEGRPGSAEEWEAMRQYDVVISTPASSSPTLTIAPPQDLFDLIFFDEAHHAPATTWAAYLNHFPPKTKFVFLTATPFRRDGRVIPGKLVYRYPVMRAAKEGAFQPVIFRPAPVQDALDDGHIDRIIAETAVAQLKADTDAGYDHRLFARASSIDAARALVPLYEELGLRVAAVDSRISKRRQDECERHLVSGQLQGIICVDMFGEGYDFPKLKVAALHAPHRSLVPTIQFIGRFARVDNVTGVATLVAPLSRVQDATSELLKDGVDLIQMIDTAARAELENSAAQQSLLERLPVRMQIESDYGTVSPLALQLYAHVRVFHCGHPPNFALIGDTVGKELHVVKQWLSGDQTISLVLTLDENPPNWATSDVLVNIRHDAFLFVFSPASHLCYIGSTRRTDKLYLSLMDTVCQDAYRHLSYEETSRARAGLQGVKFYNVGLKNTTTNSQTESYRTLTGPQAERAVTAGDGRAYVQGHFFGSGNVGEERETIGASSSSRIWSNQRLTISDFLTWVERLDARLSGDSPFCETHLDIVRPSATLRRIPEIIIAGAWPKGGFRTNPRIRYRPSNEAAPRFARLSDLELQNFDSRPDEEQLFFDVVSEEFTLKLCFNLTGGRMVTPLDSVQILEVEHGGDSWIALDSWLSSSPPVFYAADKSSFEGVNLMAPPPLRASGLGVNDARTIDWSNCEISIEFLPNDSTPETLRKRRELGARLTVQERLQKHLLEQPSLIALYFDHRAGEAADFIAFSQHNTDPLNITLYHCKGAGGPVGANRVSDVYEVSGQLVKSVCYCDTSRILEHMTQRMDARYRSPSYFVRGDLSIVESLLRDVLPTKLEFSVVGVQPGISKSRVDEHLADLMVHGISYARQGGAAQGYWLISE